MPSFTLENGVDFSYTDSGAPQDKQTGYVTLILLHGIMFHNGKAIAYACRADQIHLPPGTFASLAEIGPSNGVRVIAVNRRGYPGTTPYSAEEMSLFVNGHEEDKERLLAEMGRDLALLIAGLVASFSLPARVAVVGWSLGCLQVLSIVASVEHLPEQARRTLRGSVRSMILFQGPTMVFAIPHPEGLHVPHSDPDIPSDELSTFFARWVSSFFIHGDLTAHDPSALTYDLTDPRRPPTTARISMEHLIDFTASSKYDDALISQGFGSVTAKLIDKSLFDVHVRGKLWIDTQFFVVAGSADSWPTIYASWKLEERMLAEAKPECSITFKMVEGANHFFMIEDPQGTIDCFKDCCI
ncbi:unnamed protein product [Mycena citricolor]|uniref:AB hydrolase-1 domain-containing protein n=1 Tax=Mycena citricolor TaxID=2018698 RepID=A0AAD2GZL9_9AGAR|nr:unnamed protein product [Mycena citricolor]